MTLRSPRENGSIVSTPMTLPPVSISSSRMSKNPTSTAQSADLPTPNPLSHSKSMPSTPFQRPYSRSENNAAHSPEPHAKGSSPRSLPSDKSQTPPATRKNYGGCRFETGMARARRRVPYSLGPDPLEKEKKDLKRRLTHEEDDKLTRDMQKLYEDLQPTPESEERRTTFIAKLDKILRDRWPSSSITVNVFGSTGNNLGTADSDIDICITTDCKEMERVCSIADLLSKHGMERIVCVSSAKVPIVKVWDPEMQVACDINVNNPLALENTELVRAYVNIDSRVRPLAMIIKHWAKRRLLNDAALGGTLSSYTWICLALNFLQTRDPPIIPTLQQQANLEPKIVAGVNVCFDRKLDSYKDFGLSNKSSLGELLFHFFRYYGHEFDFEQNVVSVRLGRVLPKTEKSWNLLQDNRLCVEEPFNISRNLANTADDTSMRGIHLELRRAFEMVGDGKLETCCEQFVHPPEEIKLSEHFVPPSARPVIAQAPSQTTRGGSRNTGRGGRNPNHGNRANNARRSSNPTGRTAGYLRNLPFSTMTPQEVQLQQQHQQHLLHDQLFQQYQYLQAQEQELRMQLYQQNLRQRGLLAGYHQQASMSQYSQDDASDLASTSSQINGSRGPLSAPLHQRAFIPPSPYLPSLQPSQGISTNPPSPRMSSLATDNRRYSRRTSLTQSASGGSLRAQSQPARVLPVSAYAHTLSRPDPAIVQGSLQGRRSSVTSSTSQEQYTGYFDNGYGLAGYMYDPSRRPGEYLGYYVGQSPSLSAYSQSTAISPIPSHVGLNIQHGGLSPRLSSGSMRASSSARTPPLHNAVPSSSDGRQEIMSNSAADAEQVVDHSQSEASQPRKGPLIVDGSVNSPQRKRKSQLMPEQDEHMNFSASTSEDLAFDTPSSSDEQSQDALDFGTRDSSPPPSPSAARNRSHQHPTANTMDGRMQPNHPKLPSGDAIDSNGTSDGGVGMTSLSGMKRSSAAWTLDRQLSAVEEVASPPQQAEEYRSDGPGAQLRISTAQMPAKQQQDGVMVNGTGAEHGPDKALALRTNGAAGNFTSPSSAANVSSRPSEWQVPKKKKKNSNKKTGKAEGTAQGVNLSGGEVLPADESQRKGG